MAKAIQKIKLIVVSFVNKLLASTPTQWKLAMQTPVVVSYEKFVQNIVNETGLSRTQANAVLGAVAQCAGDYFVLGNAVQIHPDLGTLKPRITVKAQSAEKDVSVKDITGVGIRFIPTGELRSLMEGTQFQIVGKGTAGDGESDIVDPNDPDEDNNDQNNNGQNQTTEYKLTLNYHDGSQEELFYAEGATITYPANTQDYVWPYDRPRTMPARNVTLTEELDPDLDPGV